MHQNRLAFLEARLKGTQLGLSERTKLVPVSIDGQEDREPTLPWSSWDLGMFLVGVLVIGSPVCQDAQEPAFSMTEGYFPSDGHLPTLMQLSI